MKQLPRRLRNPVLVAIGCLILRCYRRALLYPFLWNSSPHVCQDVRKLAKGCSGPAELAGILVGDVILGINYKPLEKGLVHTSTLLAEAISLAGFVKLQVSEGTRHQTRRQTFSRILMRKGSCL